MSKEKMETIYMYFIPNNDTGGMGKCTKFNRWCATHLAILEYDMPRKCDLEGVHLGTMALHKKEKP